MGLLITRRNKPTGGDSSPLLSNDQQQLDGTAQQGCQTACGGAVAV
ncbi:hypothetical protein AAGU66_07355 [Edwardsiella ictaluri]|uniref:Uncharacterized protein n=1 Tax=Edwardsiella ictaluri (strain 93-146) TaxID=634503 RepID=C5BDV6_EDWI9|nr:hypothetical protein [Edwardsiella ictaluri]ACR68879.1 hypothetical protein NT01EI_1698 [Edwardsiella ictaluri 93-146]